MMNRAGGAPAWLFYVAVDALTPAIERLRQAGGSLISGPHQVPGGMWVAQCADLDGVAFALSSLVG